VQPVLGRTFLPEEDQAGAAPVVVLSHRLWQRRFGGEPDIVGQSLTLDGRNYTVIGVMPQGFEFPLFWATKAEMWAPLILADRRASRGQSLRVFARLNAGVTHKQAQAEMDLIAQRLAQAYPDTNANLNITVAPLHQKVVGDVRLMLLVLLCAVGFVLLIACANVANLQLARASARQKEIAIRLALGATRLRLVRQLLTESFVLAVLGGSAGLLLGFWIINLFVSNLPVDMLPRQQTINIDGRALGFTLLLSLLTATIFGLVPALQACRSSSNEILKEAGRRASGGARGAGLRNLLVVSEVAIALVLLVGAGLMIRSFAQLQAIDPGFNPTNILTAIVSVAGTKHAPGARRSAFFDEALEKIGALPGVESASAVNHLPLGGDIWRWPFSIEGQPPLPIGQRPSAAYRVARPNYFRTMGIPLLEGRDFSEQDSEQTPGVVIINRAMAARCWPGDEAIGKRIKLGPVESTNPWLTVIGVVKDVKQREWAEESGSEMYLPYLQSPNYLNNPAPHFSYLTLVVRFSSDAGNLPAALRSAIWAIEPDAPISSLATMEQVVADEMWQPQFSMLVLGGFSLVALALAAVGIYGVIAYSVAQRTHEIGIRMALGARAGDVLELIIRQGFKLALGGVAAGLLAAFAMTRAIKSLLFGVSATDPITFLTVTALLVTVALLACYIPARRATKVDPMIALRHE
jgi:predicted permease